MRRRRCPMAATRILIATDGSDIGTAAVDAACRVIDPATASVRVLSVYPEAFPIATEPGFFTGEYYDEMEAQGRRLAKDIVEDAEKRIRDYFPDKRVRLAGIAVRGEPDRKIVETARKWKADLIVIGSHGYGFWGRLLGSVSDGVIHHSPCSVLLVKTKEVEKLGLTPIKIGHQRRRRAVAAASRP
jgi:nucleotide-binding universal stress UspA family protein